MNNTSDQRQISIDELLHALHQKFNKNFLECVPVLNLARAHEARARRLSTAKDHLDSEAGENAHQIALAKYLDEVFADFICALYLASIGLDVPARMLLRRSLELGLVITSYWDSPVDFYDWKEHDGDVKFSQLLQYVQSDAFRTFLKTIWGDGMPDLREVYAQLPKLYSQLSNVVHPKPYNFKTVGTTSYSFNLDEFKTTLSLSKSVQEILLSLLCARFRKLRAIVVTVPLPEHS